MLEVMWEDGVTEVVPRSRVVVKAMSSAEHAEHKVDKDKVRYQCDQSAMPHEKIARIDPRGASMALKKELPCVRDAPQAKNVFVKTLEEIRAIPAPRVSYDSFSRKYRISLEQWMDISLSPEDRKEKGFDKPELTWKDIKKD